MKTKRLSQKIKKKINKALYELDNYHPHIPICDIEKIIINESGYVLLNEDNTHFEAIFCGEQGRADINIGHYNGAIWNMLHLTWYKIPSGRYEIVSYVS